MVVFPTQDRVLIKKVEKVQDKKKFILTNEEPEYEFTIMAIGEDVASLEVGDRVMLAHHRGYPVKGTDMIIMKEEDVIATLNGE